MSVSEMYVVVADVCGGSGCGCGSGWIMYVCMSAACGGRRTGSGNGNVIRATTNNLTNGASGVR